MPRRPKLVTQYLESIHRSAFDQHPELIRKLTQGRGGIYALFRKDELYYVGLATNLRTRLKHHLKDRHKDSWDRLSVYLTIGDSHLRELESLVIRITRPVGNKQMGRFAGAQNLERTFRRMLATKHRKEIDLMMGRSVREEEDEDAPEPKRTRSIRGWYKGKVFRARYRPDGTIRMKKIIYPSLSAASRAILGRPASGRWFWHLERSPATGYGSATSSQPWAQNTATHARAPLRMDVADQINSNASEPDPGGQRVGTSVFSRLKHFTPDKNDPKENHATEVLAACLRLSPAIQRVFRQTFEIPDLPGVTEWEVATQQKAGGSADQFDLVLRRSGHLAVIEVKVDSPPSSEQLGRYAKHLQTESPNAWTLRLLKPAWVADPARNEEDRWASITWHEIDRAFRAKLPELNETEKRLVWHFQAYLASERIVINMEPTRLEAISSGRIAEKMLLAFYREVIAKMPLRVRKTADISSENGWPVIRYRPPNAPTVQLQFRVRDTATWGNQPNAFALTVGPARPAELAFLRTLSAGWCVWRDLGNGRWEVVTIVNEDQEASPDHYAIKLIAADDTRADAFDKQTPPTTDFTKLDGVQLMAHVKSEFDALLNALITPQER